MIQLIVSDLDGTLLNSDHQITKRTIRFDQHGDELF